MPCRDYYDDHPQQYYKDATEPGYKKQISFAESALCAALKVIDELRMCTEDDGDLYSFIDYASAGITEAELRSWHAAHLELDAKHRTAEAAAKKAKLDAKRKLKGEQQRRANALAKLTAEDKAALGVK